MDMREALALIESMKSEINLLKSDVVALEKTNAFLVEEKSSLTDQVEDLNQQNNTLTQENSTLTEQNNTLTQENSTLTQQNKALADESKSLQEKHNSLFKEKEKLEKEKKKLEKDYKKLEKAKKKLETELYEMNKKLDEAVKETLNYKEKYTIEHVTQFVPSSETIDVIINEAEDIIKEEKEKKEKKSNTKKRGMKKNGKKNASIKKLQYDETRYEEPSETHCPKCGAELVYATQQERYVVEIIPTHVKVVKIVKRSKKCPNCSKKDHTLYYVPSQEIFPGSILTPSFASNILYNKYDLGIPLFHLSKHYSESLKIDISRQSLSKYIAKCAEFMNPLFEIMKEDLLNSPSQVIHSDETPLVVSKDKRKEEDRKKSYVYVYGSSFYDEKQINLYSFHESRAIDTTAKWLEGYKGVVVCDDFSGYTSMKNNQNIKLQRCFAHVRRRFADILKSLPQEDRKTTTAYEILELIGCLFAEEAKYKEKKYTIDKIVEMRHRNHIPIKNKLYEYAFEKEYEPNSAIAGAVGYMKNIWDDLWTYLDNGFVEITNNLAERAVKPFVVQRKVFQTAGSFSGARYTTTIFSIIRTAVINNLNVEEYLNYILKELPKIGKDKEALKKLLPYSKESIEKFRIVNPAKQN